MSGVPAPDEATATIDFAPTKLFSLGCIYGLMVADAWLCGACTHMLFRYWTHQNRDGWWTKGVVVSSATLEYLKTGWVIYNSSYHFVEKYGTYKQFFETSKLSWFPLLDSIIAGIAQAFFAHRAYRLTKGNIWVVISIGSMIATSFGSCLATKIIFARLHSLLEANKVKVSMLLWLSSTMTADLIITVTIMRGLIRSKTGWDRTDQVITRLVRLTFESQLPLLLLALAFLIEFLITPASMLGALFQGIQSKLYVMGLLYSLNARISFAAGSNTYSTAGDTAVRRRQDLSAIQVDISTETYESRMDMPPRGVNRRKLFDVEKAATSRGPASPPTAGPGLEKAHYDTDWSDGGSDAKTKFDSVSTNSKVRLTPPTPTSSD